MMRLLLAALCVPFIAWANEYPARNVQVYDGDTFTADVDVFPGMAYRGRVRIRGIDAPELRTRNACERRRAEDAREVLDVLLHSAPVTVRNVQLGKYAGRVVADVYAGNVSAAQYMIENDMARAYSGGARKGWCK